MDIIKICECCGVEFVAKRENTRFCSKKCKYKQWYLDNKEHRNQYRKQWYLDNKEYFNQYRLDNKEYIKEYRKQYRLDNKERILKREMEYRKQRKKKDPNYKMLLKCRQFIHRCLKSTKTKHTFDILGYTPEMLKQRLEMNFKSDMNWYNHGTLWHIDHVKPLCKFNFVLPDGTPDYEQIRLANSLANLKPLYVQENLSKGGK